MKYIPIVELPLLIVMVLIRAAIFRRQRVKTIVFGATDKTDFVIIPIVFSFFYGISASVFDLPFPETLKNHFWNPDFLIVAAIIVCSSALVWFGVTLKIFGKSFRVGIDENTKDELVTNGTFAIGRNPIYLAFITFFIGIFTAYPNITTLVFSLLVTATIHRQILREEKFLKNHYGAQYEEYCKKVRRYV
ncbi:MAG: isoprenylcysteine carboxylmethyltransferase family protein [Chitinispirillales bacterium]|jgi:protein-S-isoprenylcysteine O-methyltransferase Ste14|nr:isoprenylcysteine carboxylmethyltransferase family protein [Chitinispirillales bacterium]